MPRRLLRALALATAASALAVGSASAHPDNANTLHFELTCDDGNVWQASFNGGPSAFHLEGDGLYIWKQIAFVTPTGEEGVIGHGIQGMEDAPLVVCTYTGAVSGNAYTVTGFYAAD
jgi:hypothetical protein